MILKLRKFSHVDECVIQKARSFEARLDAIIRGQTQASIGDMDYISIEDIWRDTATKIQHLQEIIAFTTTCPVDKYKLYSRLSHAFFEQNQSPFDLHAFTLALGVSPVVDATQVTPYERLLIELLGAIDNQALRLNCAQYLDANITRPWRTALYGDMCLYKHAALAGNLGLIQWLESEHIKNTESYDALALATVRENQWAVVANLHKQHRLKQTTVDQLLHKMVDQGASAYVPTLWCDNRCSPTTKIIEQTLKNAVRKNDLASVQYLIICPQKPCKAVMAKAFRQAIGFMYVDIARAIAEQLPGKGFQTTLEECLSPRHQPVKKEHGLRSPKRADQEEKSLITHVTPSIKIKQAQPQERPLKRAASCSTMRFWPALHQHGFFQTVATEIHEPVGQLRRQVSFGGI